MTSFELLSAKFTFAWGFSVKTPHVSAAEFSVLLPPPSTLIGAIAYGLARQLNWSECEVSKGAIASTAKRVAEFVKSAHFGLERALNGGSPMNWVDITRVNALPFLQPKYRTPNQRATWFGIHGFGKVIMPNAKGHAMFVIDSELAREKLGEKWHTLVERSVFSMISIGSKEGFIAVDEVTMKKAKILNGRVKTAYYFPTNAIINCRPPLGELESSGFWFHGPASPHWLAVKNRQGLQGRIDIIPYTLPFYRIRREPVIVEAQLSNEGLALSTGEGPWETIIGLRRWYE